MSVAFVYAGVFAGLIISATFVSYVGDRSRNPERWRRVALLLWTIASMYFPVMWFAVDAPLILWTWPVLIFMPLLGIYFLVLLLHGQTPKSPARNSNGAKDAANSEE